MTPTEQDKELRELVHIVQNADTTYDAMQFIKADRKRVELEARINELEQVYPQLQKHYGVSGEGNYYYDDRIAELKAQQEANQ